MQFPGNANQYLTTEVFTAPPQKLQLMLIDAAIRMATRTKRHWQAQENGQAGLSLVHAQEIVDQLIRGVNREVCPELADRVIAVYMFIARRLVEAFPEQDEKKLDDAIRLLTMERETWRQVCEQLGGEVNGDHAEYISAAEKPLGIVPAVDSFEGLSATGFSLEA
jgi:flagellar secretion chaperone FliS